MFDLEKLLVTTIPTEESGPIVEACSDYNEDVKDFFICVPNQSIPDIIAYIESLPNSAYMLRLMQKSPVKGLQMLLANEHLESYTTELIKYYGGTQEFIDAVTGKNSAELDDFVPSDFSVTDSVDTEEDSTSDGDTPSDYVEDSVNSTDLEPEVKTDVVEENSYKQVEEGMVMSSAGNTPTVPLNQNDELYLMVRGITQVLGLTEFDDARTLTIEDLQEARRYIMNLSSLSIREALMAVLDQINTKADLRMITRFLELFIMYLKQNDIKR